MSEQCEGGEALRQGVPADVEVPAVVEGGVGQISVEVADPPEQMPEESQTLRRETGEKLAEIFANMREEGDSDDELDELEARVKAAHAAAEAESQEVVDKLREEARKLAEANNAAIKQLGQTTQAIIAAKAELEQVTTELGAKHEELGLAMEGLITIGGHEQAQEIIAAMRAKNPAVTEQLLRAAARHELRHAASTEEPENTKTAADPEVAEKPVVASHVPREPQPVLPVPERGELTTRIAKPIAPVEAPAEPTRRIEPVGGDESGQTEVITQPYDVRTEFTGHHKMDTAPDQASPSGQPKVPQYVARMQAMGVDPTQLAQHWPTQQ